MVELKINLPESFLKEEVRCDYTVPGFMKEAWAVQLDILNQIDEICAKHNITYFADSGTLLGAVRHKGYIPWDDDIDLMMDRKNFDLFSKYAKKELKVPYFFQDEFSEPGSLRFMGKVFNSNTTAILKIEQKREFHFNQGIFVDIFCYDNVPDDIDERKKFFDELDRLRDKSRKLNTLTYRYNPKLDPSSLKKVIKVLFSFVYKSLHLPNFYFRKLNKLAQRYNGTTCKEFGSLLFKDIHEPIQLREDYENCIDQEFEMRKIRIPGNYERVLVKFYGAKWREFEIGTSHHGDLILDTDKSYKYYLDEFKKSN